MKLKIPLLTGAYMIVVFAGCRQGNSATSATESIKANNTKKSCIACGSACKAPSRSAVVQADVNVSNAAYDGVNEMVLIPGGRFQMGSNEFPDSKPLHTVTVDAFYMDEHEVTNGQFEKFVKATGYQTVSEQALNPADYPGVPAEKLLPGSAVFTPPPHKVSLDDPLQWWQYITGANWKHPAGPESSIKGKENEPVVQISYIDALAYAKWAGKRLPTEAEWEFAARGGKANTKYYWGNELKPQGKWAANIFQGSFPDANSLEDGYKTVAPVKSFKPNGYGLYDMEGNVWEWCQDYYRPDYYNHSSAKNPKGPADSFDPDEPGAVKHVQRGGSFLCSDQYCIRYKAGARGKGEVTSASNNLGFRCVKDITKKVFKRA
jgi:formylglycine-generating enzyme